MHTLVSVVIPVRNGVRYLREAIESVLAQGQANVEVIVVDNGSTDGSSALAEGFGAPVNVVVEAQPGAAHARNLGVKLARGEYLAFLDADDVWLPGKLSRQLAALQARPDLDMVFTFGENFLSQDLTEAQRKAVQFVSGPGPFVIPSAMLARRKSFVRIGPLPDLREGEFIAWYGLALARGIHSEVIPEVLLLRRVHMANSTRLDTHHGDLLRAAKMVLDLKKETVKLS
jgi:glycosyltransferase involved in cell wall biosynthesis